jgi:IS30 family transposase
MLGILLENKTSAEVTSKIEQLKGKLCTEKLAFGEFFPLILTDNGGEFSNVFAFENNAQGAKECSLFFCDPMQSCQKGKIEKNHTLFRDIVPKGESFDSFTQETVNLIFSHVNSIRRKVLGCKSPFDLFAFTFGKKLPEILGIHRIPDNEVIQSPKLLKQ